MSSPGTDSGTTMRKKVCNGEAPRVADAASNFFSAWFAFHRSARYRGVSLRLLAFALAFVLTSVVVMLPVLTQDNLHAFWHDTLESLFGVKNLLQQKTNQQNVEQGAGKGQTQSS